jgi:hypothetical protein
LIYKEKLIPSRGAKIERRAWTRWDAHGPIGGSGASFSEARVFSMAAQPSHERILVGVNAEELGGRLLRTS